MSKDITCIICPISCRLRIGEKKRNNGTPVVTGAECHRGVRYALSEINDPRRLFTSTVKVIGGEINLVPVRTDRPIRKNKWKQARESARILDVKAPVRSGSVIKGNFTEEGINLIATREINKY